MSWIVLGEDKGKVILVSKSTVTGLLPKGSYLTVEQGESKFILRVDQSAQSQPYSPSPMLIDMDLTPLKQDQKCQNIISAVRVKDVNNRSDGFIDFLKPQTLARRSTQEEVDLALSSRSRGPKVFPATVYGGTNNLLTDKNGNLISVSLPQDMFWHQILVCGKVGTGKTVSSKYLSQYFIEVLEGCVLAINVKEDDLLHMNEASYTQNGSVIDEWNNLNMNAHGIDNFMIYFPATTDFATLGSINTDLAQRITLDARGIDPESLIGLLHGISDLGAQNLPDIYRYWLNLPVNIRDPRNITFAAFMSYFNNNDTREFNTMNRRGDTGTITIHTQTFRNIQRNLAGASEFFDSPGARSIDETDILETGKYSVIDVVNSRNGTQFGSILLRDLLRRIIAAKDRGEYDLPVLIIIDEVHQFYNDQYATEALGDLDKLSRVGRSKRIGVIFSSQNPNDIPKGLSNVINTKIFFNSDPGTARKYGINISGTELESLKKGYACCTIYDMSQLKIIKFPLALAGVFERDN